MAAIESPAPPPITANFSSPVDSRLSRFSRTGRTSSRSRHAEDLFPIKLYEMLDEVEAEGLSEAVSWKTHGRAFAVNDKDLFMRKVVPRYFKATKIRSFHRQLHLWGFNRIATGRDAGSWWHPSFVRSRPGDLKHMVRKSIKGKPLVHYVPDFYAATPVSTTQKRLSKDASPGGKDDFVDIDDEELRMLFREEATASSGASLVTHSGETALPLLPVLPFSELVAPRLPTLGRYTLDRRSRNWSSDTTAAASSGSRADRMVVLDQPISGVGKSSFHTSQKNVLTISGKLDLLPLIRSSSAGGCVTDEDAAVDVIDEFSAFIDETIQLP